MRAAILACVALCSCATPSIQRGRERGDLRATVAGRTFDGLVGCIGEAITIRYQMTYTPSVSGGAFTYSAGSVSGPAMILVEVIRAEPPRAEVRVSGGPWLGNDRRVTRAVQDCEGR